MIDKCAAVVFFANVNINKANSHIKWIIKSDHMTLQVIRLVMNIRVKERAYSVFKNKVLIILMQ
jgi:hypothetical protein